jgi:UDP-N-acetylglucosamine 4,6-dehydratase
MKRLLLTGGSGTVGSAFIKTYRDEYEFHVVSRNEKLQHELKVRFPEVKCYLGSVEDKEALYNVCDKARPGIILHAAALKHVDIAERDPVQTMRVNVLGSLNVVDAAIAFNVPVTVAVSTDKACNHQNIYGMSKFLMERCFLHANADRNRFAACRFANVAHSNGSVIPLFLRLAAEGKPLRLTDPNMNRMMFSQDDAAKLIRKTIDFTHWTGGGFVMTKLMKNVNMGALARMISDNVEIVGSRPGEKINEDLISASELPFTTLVEDEYVMIGNTVSSDDRRLTQPVNSETAKQMSDSELRQLVYDHASN